jgi:hypothetical protein
MNSLSYGERDALQRILRKHGITTREALEDLSTLLQWVHDSERSRSRFVRDREPMPLISLLGNMGIYGKDFIDTVVTDE